MALSIRSKKVEQLARDLAHAEGVSITEVLMESLSLKQAEISAREGSPSRVQCLIHAVQELPILNERSVNDILGFDADGGFSP